jgi:hypothetical protein
MRDPVARRPRTPTRLWRLQFQAGNSRTFQLRKLDLGICGRPMAHGTPASPARASIGGTDVVSHAALASKRASTCRTAYEPGRRRPAGMRRAGTGMARQAAQSAEKEAEKQKARARRGPGLLCGAGSPS